MCTRYRIGAKKQDLERRYGAKAAAATDAAMPGEAFPKRLGWVVTRPTADTPRLETMTWGFPPPPGARAPVVNVRNLGSPFWRDTLSRTAQRCLVPVTAFCEWEGAAGRKRDRWFSVPTLEIFSFAGIWRETPAGPVYAFLTCAPNPLVAAVHPKAMPVILHPDDEARWFSAPLAETVALAASFPSRLMALAPLPVEMSTPSLFDTF